jgi:hypothetical protein
LQKGGGGGWRGAEQQFDWCQLLLSIHFFHLAPFLSTCFFLCGQQLRLVFLFWIIIQFCITTFQCTTFIFYPTKLHPKHHELCTVASGTITLPLQIADPVLDISGRERTCSVSGEGVTPHIYCPIIFAYRGRITSWYGVCSSLAV